MTKQPHLLLGVTGSIAAYKAAELVRLARRAGWDVTVIMTQAATRFVGELTFFTLSQNKVHVDLFASPEEWVPGHISLADRADLFVVAPCTANVLAKLAHGLADDLLTCTALACPAPLLIAPAMNTRMWQHPATQANVAVLGTRGARFVEVGDGELACGTTGQGRMAEPVAIFEAARAWLAAADGRP